MRVLFVIIAIIVACSTINLATAEENHLEKANRVIACAFTDDQNKKANACAILDDSEKRVLKCATQHQNKSRLETCRDLNQDELKLVPIVDAHRKRGTQFNLKNVRKLGEPA